ncbi:MAG: phosphate acyltransferase [Acidimicrobiia bacterium]|nr:MAG: phosphate acyltransferase [Acidimicrobiia bacterium]
MSEAAGAAAPVPVVAVDAMGGDRAPAEIVAGALAAADRLDVEILLAGPPDVLARHLPGGRPPAGVTLLPAAEVVAMDDEPAAAIRTKKDASVVRCAEAVRDGRADAMVGAGNTGATMAAALLRMGRIRGVQRPAIAVPLPVPGTGRTTLLLDAGATVDPEPEWLVQWARLGRELARLRFGIAEPTVGLLSNGEEPGKGDELRKRAAALLGEVKGFAGNVEGRDLLRGTTDVVVTDGFTGNVALKALEGALAGLAGLVLGVVGEPGAPWAAHAAALQSALLAAAAPLLPDNTGGAVLAGVDGVCVISHGSSTAEAIVNAVRVARDGVTARTVERLAEAVRGAG